MDPREALIRRYFDACNAADFDGLVSCFTPDAVHYFPPGLPGTPWRSAEAIARGWLWCVENLGSRWSIERILLAEGGAPEAVIEWTHWKTKTGTAQRGDEWYRFDSSNRLIAEIRAYYASPAVQGVPIGELGGFDYAGRGYHLEPP
ncbi:MAG: nuclear transport factor 2 family protein [Chloroflexota bacterium]|nr:nuclear transport factor 2 family protein [Chloroflexota bacterium]